MSITISARAPLPTEHGTFEMVVFEHRGVEHFALLHGDIAQQNVWVRVHSACITGEALGSLKCDCGQQLDHALSTLGRRACGMLVYLQQEGRGIGLANKVRAYALQARGADTVDANRALGLPDDDREYHAASALLRHLGVRSIRLITNNLHKARALEADGITVLGLEPSWMPTNAHSAHYLATKRDRMEHRLPARLLRARPSSCKQR